MELPTQFNNLNFRFIKLKERSKVPIETNWQIDNNYLFDELKSHKGNIGAVCGIGKLRVIDCDEKEFAEIIKKKIPDTFTIKTGAGGLHFYMISDYDTNHVFIDGKGEFRAKTYQIVCPGSIHPNGKMYQVVNDVPIKTITKKEVEKIIKPYLRPDITQPGEGTTKDGSRSGMEFGQVIKFINKGLSKEQVFNKMNAFSKWGTAHPAYREKTYNKAELVVKTQLIEKKTFSTQVLEKIALKQMSEATELIVKKLLEDEKIYTIRNDEQTEMYYYREGIYIPRAKTYIQEFCRKTLGEVYSQPIYSKVLTKIIADTFVDPEIFFTEQDINKIVVQNGILNIKEMKLEEFNSDYFFFQKLPVVYDPSKNCDKIIKHFETVLENKEDIKVMQELVGFCLYRNYFLGKAFMFTGGGRNGKGITITLLKHFLGSDNISNVPLQQFDKDNFSISMLNNKLANLSGDLSKTALNETGMFKSLTGNDLISANRKHLTRINFTNYAKMVFCCNELPMTYDLTVAFFNRWIILNFPYTFLSKNEVSELNEDDKVNVKEANPSILEDILDDEQLSGLLNWALIGLKGLLKDKSFSYCQTTDNVKKSWLRKSNSFNAFCMDKIESNFEEYIEKSDLRKEYGYYCRKYKLRSTSDKIIKHILQDMFGASENRKSIDGLQKTIWEGIKIRQVS